MRQDIKTNDLAPLGTVMGPVDFDECFRNDYPRVTRSAIMMVGDADLGREIAQESFVRLYERLEAMTSSDHARAFVFKVAANLARSHLRRARRVLLFGLRPGERASRLTTDGTEQSNDRLILRQALADLSRRQRVCIVLVDYAGLDAPTVARILHMSPTTVHVHLHRGRQRLSAALAGTYSGKEIP